jgi:hypothetical protein
MLQTRLRLLVLVEERLLFIHSLILLSVFDTSVTLYFPTLFLVADLFWLRKITTDPHILPHVNTECSDDRYPKLKIYISELILDIYEYISLTCVALNCMI